MVLWSPALMSAYMVSMSCQPRSIGTLEEQAAAIDLLKSRVRWWNGLRYYLGNQLTCCWHADPVAWDIQTMPNSSILQVHPSSLCFLSHFFLLNPPPSTHLQVFVWPMASPHCRGASHGSSEHPPKTFWCLSSYWKSLQPGTHPKMSAETLPHPLQIFLCQDAWW